ncbi:uncharacterized protein BDW70DRAFT_140792 [Aspergillus foveolatus]|uniref:uncharacterized protein n=1 Tax=Aspergillus foveolatus TaxID=210207 RepID=UPI003CCDE3E5
MQTSHHPRLASEVFPIVESIIDNWHRPRINSQHLRLFQMHGATVRLHDASASNSAHVKLCPGVLINRGEVARSPGV